MSLVIVRLETLSCVATSCVVQRVISFKSPICDSLLIAHPFGIYLIRCSRYGVGEVRDSSVWRMSEREMAYSHQCY